MFTRRTLLHCCLAAAGLLALPATAQDYPSRPITMLVPFAAGGSSDILARVFGAALANQLGQPVVIENKPGAGGIIAAQYVSRAEPDGYTLFYSTNGPMAILPAMKKQPPYDPNKDFTPIARLADGLLVLLVPNTLPVRDTKELLAYARANPGKLSFASAGIGSVSHLAGEYFKSEAGIDIVHIPYKGGGAATPDLQAGQVQMMLETNASSLAVLKGGKVRALAVSSDKRYSALPDVPTFAEAGLPNLTLSTWSGLFAPARLPAPILGRLTDAIAKINTDPAYIASFAKYGSLVPAPTSPERFASFVKDEGVLWGKMLKAAGVQPE